MEHHFRGAGGGGGGWLSDPLPAATGEAWGAGQDFEWNYSEPGGGHLCVITFARGCAIGGTGVKLGIFLEAYVGCVGGGGCGWGTKRSGEGGLVERWLDYLPTEPVGHHLDLRNTRNIDAAVVALVRLLCALLVERRRRTRGGAGGAEEAVCRGGLGGRRVGHIGRRGCGVGLLGRRAANSVLLVDVRNQHQVRVLVVQVQRLLVCVPHLRHDLLPALLPQYRLQHRRASAWVRLAHLDRAVSDILRVPRLQRAYLVLQTLVLLLLQLQLPVQLRALVLQLLLPLQLRDVLALRGWQNPRLEVAQRAVDVAQRPAAVRRVVHRVDDLVVVVRKQRGPRTRLALLVRVEPHTVLVAVAHEAAVPPAAVVVGQQPQQRLRELEGLRVLLHHLRHAGQPLDEGGALSDAGRPAHLAFAARRQRGCRLVLLARGRRRRRGGLRGGKGAAGEGVDDLDVRREAESRGARAELVPHRHPLLLDQHAEPRVRPRVRVKQQLRQRRHLRCAVPPIRAVHQHRGAVVCNDSHHLHRCSENRPQVVQPLCLGGRGVLGVGTDLGKQVADLLSRAHRRRHRAAAVLVALAAFAPRVVAAAVVVAGLRRVLAQDRPNGAVRLPCCLLHALQALQHDVDVLDAAEQHLAVRVVRALVSAAVRQLVRERVAQRAQVHDVEWEARAAVAATPSLGVAAAGGILLCILGDEAVRAGDEGDEAFVCLAALVQHADERLRAACDGRTRRRVAVRQHRDAPAGAEGGRLAKK
eukprot:Rhum_TRINITY_DN14618_c24_g1::Rhum_TRINITY_DN14618_c24_g1_i1::g.106045::m.106045